MGAIVIIPTYNERDNIRPLVGDLLNLYSGLRILIVDDNSPDGTGEIADEIARRNGSVNVLHGKIKEGLGRAYIRGFKGAFSNTDSDIIITMDADFSHAPHYIGAFLKRLEGYDVIVGSRYINGISVVNWPLRRIILSSFANRYVRFITGLPLADSTSGFMCFRREALEDINLDSIVSDGYSFLVELKFRAYLNGARIAEEPIIFVERRDGETKMSLGNILEASIAPWKLRLLHK